MAQYIEGYCDQQMPPPYQFQNVQIWSFPVLADLGKVQGIVERFLGPAAESLEIVHGADGTPAAQTTLVYVTVLDYGRMACLSPPESAWGYVTQRELYTGILMASLDPPDVVLFTPYIFVDNPWSAVCGNMVLGYPKQLASFQMGPGTTNPYPIRVDPLVFPQYSPSTPLQSRPLAQITQAISTAPPESQPDSMLGDLDQLFGAGGVLPVDADVLAVLQDNAFSYQMMQLKQVRSGQSPDQACYRAIVSGTVTVESIQPGGGFLPSAKVRFGSYASSDIAQALGLRSISAAPFQLTCSFTLGDVQEREWD